MKTTVPTPRTSTPASDDIMNAVIQDLYGSDPDDLLRVGEVPRPSIGPREVLVEVAAASVDRGTWHLMSGRPQLMRLMGFGFRRPKALNPGRSFAGTIVSIGESISGMQPGEAVYGTGEGAFAEYVAAPADKVARKPTNLSFEQAATAPVSAVTAIQAVRDAAQVRQGQRVLIIGASGGVGTFLVQLVKAFGGHVTAVASTAKLDLVRGLGADEVIDYSRENFADGRRMYDVILDTGGNHPLSQIRRVLAPDGTLVIIGGENDGRWLGGFARNLKSILLAPFVRGQRLRSLASKENAADLDALRALFEAGQVAPAIDRSYPLSETAAAIRRLTDGQAQGKIVITM